VHLVLHLTTRCNQRCRYCDNQSRKFEQDMTFDTVKAAIKLAMKNDDPDFPSADIGIGFYGGEPLLKRELIYQTVTYCREIQKDSQQKFHYRLTTNGLLLDEEFLSNPLTSDIVVALSHDGIQPDHDTNRIDQHGQGSFGRLEEKIDLLLRYRPEAYALMVITPETLAYYSDSVAFLYSRGFRNIAATLDYSNDWLDEHLPELRRQYQALAKWYERLSRDGAEFSFAPFDAKIANFIRPGSCMRDRCALGREQVSIAPSGRIYPCVQFVEDDEGGAYCLGNVEDGLDKEKRFQLYEENAAEKDTCVSCAIRERCSHYCGCMNKQATGSIDQVSPVTCAHERIVLPIADKLAEKLFKKGNLPFMKKHYRIV